MNKKILVRSVAAIMMAVAFTGYNVYFTQNYTRVLADDVVVNVSSQLQVADIKVEYTNASGVPTNKLFDIKELYPGDEIKGSTVTITNNDDAPISITMSAEHTLSEVKNLAEILNLTVSNNGTQLYKAKLKDFVTPAVDLGSYAPGTQAKLDFAIDVSPEEFTNEYQAARSDFKVIFTIVSAGGPTPTPTPTPTPPITGGGGGGGGGGGTQFVPGSPIVLVPQPVPQGPPIVRPPTVVIPPEQVPEAVPEVEQIIDEEVPLGPVKELPQTGEESLITYIAIGTLLIGCGMMLMVGGKRRKKA